MKPAASPPYFPYRHLTIEESDLVAKATDLLEWYLDTHEMATLTEASSFLQEAQAKFLARGLSENDWFATPTVTRLRSAA